MYSSHPLCADRQIHIDEFEDFYFNTDPTILIRSLGNMVKNALEASEPGENDYNWLPKKGWTSPLLGS